MVGYYVRTAKILNELRDKNELGNEMRSKFLKYLYKKFGYMNSSMIVSGMHIGSPCWKSSERTLYKIAGG